MITSGQELLSMIRAFLRGFALKAFNLDLAGAQSSINEMVFRKAFSNFSVDKVARFTEAKINKLLDDPSIVRHRGKIEATINNAKHSKALIKEFGSLDQYFSSDAASQKEKVYGAGETLTSKAISKDLKKRGFKFLGPTTVYSFMQAQGYVNDHEKTCFVYDEVEKLRLKNEKRTS